MMDKTCYLHIGSPKTGSTSIQAWCFRNKAQLAQKGLLYPGIRQRHDALLSEFHDRAWNLRFNRLGQDLSQDGLSRAMLTEEYAETEASAAQAVLFSNENFLGLSRRIRIQALQQELTAQFREVRLLCYLRDPYKLLISRAQEHIKSGKVTYEQAAEDPPVLSMAGLEKYAAVFGREAMVLRNFDALKTSGTTLMQDCLETLLPGVSQDGLEPSRVHNSGFSLEAALIIGGLNGKYGYHSDWDGRHLPVQRLRSIGRTRFTLPPAAVLKVREQLMRQYDLLAKAGLEFTPPDWQALPEPRPDWSPETLEQVALVMNSLAADGRKGGPSG
ncbi:hypothetical protein [Leisingera sp. ANG-Vp]|uniref:hypothetical protein n=1 Tax=Leisingera sp. ANG-Vp TaxID=1577896 RepID=UPI00057D5509|nr:hypothetical protein [Leisingera sp. ANG-Vp]KIC15141.1 hypothetical protein RA20_19010 [Leisingera sp. ANG-Vp]